MRIIRLTACVAALLYAGVAIGEPVLQEVPLQWHDVARLDGDVVYDNLCLACHGPNARGDGPAAGYLARPVPDLTALSDVNSGTFPHKRVEQVIGGKTRIFGHGLIDMPTWEQQFSHLRGGGIGFAKEAYARNRIHELATYLESLQEVGAQRLVVAD